MKEGVEIRGVAGGLFSKSSDSRRVLKVAQVVPRVNSPSSGISEAVPRLCGAIQDQGQNVKLLALKPAPQVEIFSNAEYFPYSRLPFGYRLGISRQLRRALREFARNGDIIHTNSIWMMPNIYPAAAVRDSNCALVLSPHGTVSPWALSWARTRKWLMWNMRQRKVFQKADCIHATSQAELDEIRSLQIRKPIAVIPNGVDCPDSIKPYSTSHKKTLLFLSRIHPKKGLDILIESWSKLETNFPRWNLRVVGPVANNPYASEMQKRAAALGVKNIEFSGELFGEAKEQAYRQSDLFVLPSHSENFGICVAEALSHGVPAIVFKGAPWQGLSEHGAGWWIDSGVDALTETLEFAMSRTSEELHAMGVLGHQWVRDEMDWKSIGERMVAVYQWLTRGADMPNDVYND